MNTAMRYMGLAFTAGIALCIATPARSLSLDPAYANPLVDVLGGRICGAGPGTSLISARIVDSAGSPRRFTAVRFSVLLDPVTLKTEGNVIYPITYTNQQGIAVTVVSTIYGSFNAAIDVQAEDLATGEKGISTVPVDLNLHCDYFNQIYFPDLVMTQGNPYIALGSTFYWFSNTFSVYNTDPRSLGVVRATVQANISAMDIVPLEAGSATLIVPHLIGVNASVLPVNPNAPVISSTPITTVAADTVYSYQIAASSPGGRRLSYSLDTAPLGMSLGSSGLLNWTPTAANAGENIVRIAVSDGTLSTYHHFRLRVTYLCVGLGDMDTDGVCDPSDNCPYRANPDQLDLNADGMGDACDIGRRYRLTALGNLPGGGFHSQAYGLNDKGQVVGSSNSGYGSEAFLWDPLTGMRGLGALPGGVDFSSIAYDVNEMGQVVGTSTSLNSPYRTYDAEAFLWDSAGMIGLGDLPGGSFGSIAFGINNRGQVVGRGRSADGIGEAFLWSRADGMKSLGDLPGGKVYSWAEKINDAGQVTGVGNFGFGDNPEAFRWDAVNGMQGLGYLPGGGRFFSLAVGINATSQIVGWSQTNHGGTEVLEAFRWDPATGSMSGLGDLPGGDFYSIAHGINDAGEIVGRSVSGKGEEPFVWIPGQGMHALNALLDATATGWSLVDAMAINNGGQITGWGTNPAGFYEAFLLTPYTNSTPPRILASPISISGQSGEEITWQPIITSSVTTPPPTCVINIPPANGTATVAADCTSGTYRSNPGFIGTDSFDYEASVCPDLCYRGSARVTVAVTEPPPTDPCLVLYPVTQFTQTGKQGTLSITFTGNISSHANKEVKVCPGTTLSYQSTSTQGPVICKIKNSTTRGSGTLRIRDHLKCTDKPAGKDKVHFKVKSGMQG